MTVYDIFFEAKVWVVNNGNMPLNSIKLNYKINLSSFCGFIFSQKNYANLNVAPRGSILLTTDNLWYKYYDNNILQNNINVTFCIFTTLPNNENDKNVINDGLCKPLLFNIIPSSIKEIVLDKMIVDLSPNPFNERITLTSQLTIKTIEILDVYGKIIYSATINSTSATIDEPTLKSGIYFVKINFNTGFTTKKIIKY